MADENFTRASVKPEAFMPGPDETGIKVFVMDAASGPIYFEVKYDFYSGNAFKAVISNFGIPDIFHAGSQSARVRRKFSASEIQSAKQRIEEYFSGPERKGFWPFNTDQGHFSGVEFSTDWITQEA